MKRRRRMWGDLPHDILGFIFGKSADAVDVIRFRAVCKNWRNVDLPTNNLPWLCNLSWSNSNSFNLDTHLKCEIHDPYSGRLFVTWKHVRSRYRYPRYSNSITCFGTNSNNKGLIAGYPSLDFINWAIFIYNPYTKHFISLPCIKCDNPLFATFSGNRVVFLFSCREFNVNYIASYFLNGAAKKEWTIVRLRAGATLEQCRGLQFVKEQLLFLFSDGIMRSYSFSSSSSELGYLKLVSLRKGSHRLAEGDQRLWLAKGDGDLLVACELDSNDEWATFYFDWSSMRWMASDLRVISVDVGRPLAAGCDRKVYLVREGEYSNYIFKEMRNVRGEYDSDTVFIEPPRIRRCL